MKGSKVKGRLNHYYPAAIFAVGYSKYAEGVTKDRRDLKVNYINAKNLSTYLKKYKANNYKLKYEYQEITNILTEILFARDKYDSNTAHRDRLLSEIPCDSIFTNTILDEDPADKENERRINKIETPFLDFLSKLKELLNDSNSCQNISIYLNNNAHLIKNFLGLTIDRVPFFNHEDKNSCKKTLSNSKMYFLNYDVSTFIMSDLLPIIPIRAKDIQVLKDIVNENLEYNNTNLIFPFTDDQIKAINENPILVYPITSSSIVIICEEHIMDFFIDENFTNGIKFLYTLNTMIFSNELIVYHPQYESSILHKIIHCYLNIDIESERKKFTAPYKSILHTKII